MAIQNISVDGWEQLMDANLVGAAFTMYNLAFAGWVVALLFFVYQFMLALKTRNMTLTWVTGFLFASLYAISSFVEVISLKAIFILLVFELGCILYMWFFSN